MTTVDLEKPVGWRHSTRLFTSSGTGYGQDVEWKMTVRSGDSGRITREVRMDGELWVPESREWCPELTIWPSWSPAEESGGEKAGETPLQGVHDYWSASDDRLRDSAKWMAAVLGAALAALIGTSPLAGMRNHHPAGAAIGEFYRVRFRSTCATYYGLLTGLAGTAGVVAAFGWPLG